MNNGDLFEKYIIKVNKGQAAILLDLIEEHIDYTLLTAGDVMDINMVHDQLARIMKMEEEDV